MQDKRAAELVKRLLQQEQLTQTELASKAGVHQSTVSRVTKMKKVARQGKAKARLIDYAQNALSGDLAKGEEKILTAFKSIWDGSEEHAAAIARVIGATAELRPPKRRPISSSRNVKP
jgi:transcriptional regulator with XRE-family HTH domain